MSKKEKRPSPNPSEEGNLKRHPSEVRNNPTPDSSEEGSYNAQNKTEKNKMRTTKPTLSHSEEGN